MRDYEIQESDTDRCAQTCRDLGEGGWVYMYVGGRWWATRRPHGGVHGRRGSMAPPRRPHRCTAPPRRRQRKEGERARARETDPARAREREERERDAGVLGRVVHGQFLQGSDPPALYWR